MINFNNEVQEVIDFAMQYHFLFGDKPPEELNVKLVTEIPKDNLDAGPDGKNYKDLTEGEIEYRGIREIQISKAIGLFSRDKKKNAESETLEHIFIESNYLKKLEKILSPPLENRKLFWDESDIVSQQDIITDLIRGDMLDCSFSRLAFGKCGNFWDTVFEIYKSGGMPVGWSGKYPEGRFMAIYPGLKMK